MFRTVLTPSVSDWKIHYKSKLITLGSCFADSIGNSLRDKKLHVNVNPFGIVYNPLSIYKLIHYALEQSSPEPDTYVRNQGVFYNYDFHSDFSALSLEELNIKVKHAIKSTHDDLTNCEFLFITLGTSIVYFQHESHQPVANCHKVAASEFNRNLVSQETIISGFDSVHRELMKINPDIKFILTVSPVRHLKDTLELNSVSKSILRISCHTLQETYDNVAYFPAYEILLDDLRDYRFYDRDLLHPNETAEEYIWERFQSTFMDAQTVKTLKEWEAVKKSLEHKPFHKGSEAHQAFLFKTLGRLNELRSKIDVSSEISDLKKQIQG